MAGAHDRKLPRLLNPKSCLLHWGGVKESDTKLLQLLLNLAMSVELHFVVVPAIGERTFLGELDEVR